MDRQLNLLISQRMTVSYSANTDTCVFSIIISNYVDQSILDFR